jgi:hypothetical protein
MNIGYIVVGLWLLVALAVFYAIDHAPDGDEDETGFHPHDPKH